MTRLHAACLALVAAVLLAATGFRAAPAAPDAPAATAVAASVAPPVAGAEGHGAVIVEVLAGLLVILLGAKLGGEIFERRGQPAVLGEILFGVLLGNLELIGFHGFTFLRTNEPIEALAELGVILLLFEVGLETDLQEMRAVGLSSFLVAVLGVVAPSLLGWGVSRVFLPHEPEETHWFIGTILCATSVGITARVLRDLGQLQRPEARIVLGAAVVDDVLGLLVLAVVSGLITARATGAGLGVADVAEIVAKAVGFLVLAFFVGRFLSPRLYRLASYLQVRDMLLVTTLAFCFLLAWLAARVQLAPIVGAFAAGVILDPVHYQVFRERGEQRIEDLIRPISGFLVPIFFVLTGVRVELGALARPEVLGFATALTLAAIVGKQACALGVVQRGLNRMAVGLGMIPRGEVGLIFASIGLTLFVLDPLGGRRPVVSAATFSAVVVMVLVTTLITPPLLKWSLAKNGGRQAEPPAPTAQPVGSPTESACEPEAVAPASDSDSGDGSG